ncbi:peptidase S8/S53 domain-containing protein [Coniella lustricola]|uniref:Peptidase S8/S53 domain-containing protein n=1 Tax=Coniella lustricola TaxID=2025994 RepID=A0A2T3ALV8_9PEZI|nr:peptidase S8/S53 domain-containing protein [Coniella lustricola]
MTLDHSVFRGASFKVVDPNTEDQHISMISNMPAVNKIWPIRRYHIPNLARMDKLSNPSGAINIVSENGTWGIGDEFPPHVMTQVDQLHALGCSGEGIRIGIVDTGVDWKHPALGGCFGEGCLVAYGFDLVGDEWDGLNIPKPDGNPYDDCNGHGTHVSGMIAAQTNPMNFTGVAPGVQLGMYKVFSCASTGTTDDVLISAFGRAFDDGSDIITASIGSLVGWRESPWGKVVSRIVKEGVPCTLAAGNDGFEGLFTPSDAADGDGVTAVGSFDNIVTPYLLPKGTYAFSSRAEKGSQTAEFSWLPGLPTISNATMPLRAVSNNDSVHGDACSSLPIGMDDLSGSIVLVRLGGCSPSRKAKNLEDAGAHAILFFADTFDNFDTIDLTYSAISINMTATITPAQGARFLELLDQGAQVQITFVDPHHADFALIQIPNNLTGGFASTYTSWGPTWELDFYPTVAAPGGNILSTFLLNQGGYAVFSGTSMATPFVAGVYALVMQARGEKRMPQELRSLLSSTSKANFWNDGTGSIQTLGSTAQQGAGLVQAHHAAFVKTIVGCAGVSFNDTDNLPPNVTFAFQNTANKTVACNISHVPAIGMYALSSVGGAPETMPKRMFAAAAEVGLSSDSVELEAGERATISISLMPPSEDMIYHALLPVYGGYVVINCSNNEDLSVPYLGVAGSMNRAVVLDPYVGFIPGVESSTVLSAANQTYTVPYPTINETIDLVSYYGYPWATVNLNLGTRMLRADVVPVMANYTGTTSVVNGRMIAGSVWGYPQDYIGRGSVDIVFTGLLDGGRVVPEGKYALSIRALSIFGDPETSLDWQGMTTNPFYLRYDKT